MTKTQKFAGNVQGYGITPDMALKHVGSFQKMDVLDIYCINGNNPDTFRIGVQYQLDGKMVKKESLSTDKGLYRELCTADERVRKVLYIQIFEQVMSAHAPRCVTCDRILKTKKCGWCGTCAHNS